MRNAVMIPSCRERASLRMLRARRRMTPPVPSNPSRVEPTPEIIDGMRQLALEQQRVLGPRAPWHIGDVAWGLRQHENREPEWTFRLWRDGGDRIIAWSWLQEGGLLEYDFHP